MANPLYLIYLDRYHLSDLLFLQTIARTLSAPGAKRIKGILVHGSAEIAERLLEAEGLILGASNEPITPRNLKEGLLLERALREENRKIVSTLTEEGVAAVGIHGMDKGLVRMGDGGRLEVGKVSWLVQVAEQGAFPVVSSLIENAGQHGVGESSMSDLLAALCKALEKYDITPVIMPRGNQIGVMNEGKLEAQVSLEKAEAAMAIALPEVVRSLVEAGHPVLLTQLDRLGRMGEEAGTFILP